MASAWRANAHLQVQDGPLEGAVQDSASPLGPARARADQPANTPKTRDIPPQPAATSAWRATAHLQDQDGRIANSEAALKKESDNCVRFYEETTFKLNKEEESLGREIAVGLAVEKLRERGRAEEVRVLFGWF